MDSTIFKSNVTTAVILVPSSNGRNMTRKGQVGKLLSCGLEKLFSSSKILLLMQTPLGSSNPYNRLKQSLVAFVGTGTCVLLLHTCRPNTYTHQIKIWKIFESKWKKWRNNFLLVWELIFNIWTLQRFCHQPIYSLPHYTNKNPSQMNNWGAAENVTIRIPCFFWWFY